jgi:hypothetical protein
MWFHLGIGVDDMSCNMRYSIKRKDLDRALSRMEFMRK